LLTVNVIKARANKSKIPQSRLHCEFKAQQMNILSQYKKLFHAGGLKSRDVPSGTAILISAVRRRYGQNHIQKCSICT
jgi:hypothetical protein